MPYATFIKQQREYFASGATVPLIARCQALINLRAQITACATEINQALYADLGKGLTESYLSEIGLVLKEISHVLRRLRRWAKPRRALTPMLLWPAKSRIHYQPLGVVLILAPWNYPLQLSLLPLVDALAAGNCVILKPSPKAPNTSRLLTKIVSAACAPELALVLEGDDQAAGRLLEEKFDFIFYTGSTRVGHLVMRAAARHLTPVCLELGGKSPVIVAHDANLKLAARRIAWGKILNAGQTCVAPDHVWAHASIHDQLIKLIEQNFRHMLGNFPLENQNYGRIINIQAFMRIIGLSQKPLTYDQDKLKIAPQVLPSQPDDPIMQEEIFGPLLPILAYRDIEQVIGHIKQGPRPLGLYLFSRSRSMQQHVLNSLSFGNGCINDVVIQAASPYLGFGGVGASGMGRYHGRVGFELFSNPRSIVHSSGYIDIALRYPPYGKQVLRLLKMLL